MPLGEGHHAEAEAHRGGEAPVPLSSVMIDYVRHLEHHLAQILDSQ